jgi:glutathione synthase/RimK-type ligase-like ATP-grasp enzyme
VSRQIIVVENPRDWQGALPDCPVVHVDDYLVSEEYFRASPLLVINLCRSQRYLSIGYYCSLLAEARRQKVIPSVKTMLDLSRKSMYSLDAVDLDSLIQRRLSGRPDTERFAIEVYFGYCRIESLGGLARQIFERFPAPLLRVKFEHQQRWRIASIKPIALNSLDEVQRREFEEALVRYRGKPRRAAKGRKPLPYDLAMLVNPDDPLPPSNRKALERFIRAARDAGIDAELVQRRDLSRLAEFDALFIRDTTNINHYTYHFAKKAESEGMVVIDDPRSILRCTNKVYLAELLRARGIPTPKTLVVGKQDLDAAEQALGFPMVLKMPEGSFSRGVFKVDNGKHLRQVAATLFRESELILAQAYTYTEFDWRIGIIDRRPIYACQYFMSKRHWQIIKHDESGAYDEGVVKTWPVETVPADVVETALKAANLIGDGLYGVDLKQGREGIYVIEINDNPSIDAGIEDMVLKDGLYATIMGEFARRIERRRAWGR